MDQHKIGRFLQELRKEKKITQEQFAEQLGVSGRTISRWETGSNMPDISLLVEISEFYDVSIPEIINGERKSENMEKEVKEIAEVMSDYATTEKELLLKRAKIVSIVGTIALLIGLIMLSFSDRFDLPIYASINGTCFGLALGALLAMIFYTTGILEKMRKRKSKRLKIIVLSICSIIAVVSLVISLIMSLK